MNRLTRHSPRVPTPEPPATSAEPAQRPVRGCGCRALSRPTTLGEVNRRRRAARGIGFVGVCALTGSLLAGPALAGQTTAPTPCAISDLQPVTASPVPPERKPAPVLLGGEALAGNTLAVAPGSPPLPAGLAATSWLVADLDTGQVIGACGAHRLLAPASVQKVLLAATVLPKLNLADAVMITPEDLDFGAEWDSKTVPLQVGVTYPVEDLFLGLMLRSGNDAANALARVAGGGRGVAGTIEDMNAEAHRLGAWDTHAVTPSGLDGHGQATSAYDLALIFRAASTHEEFRRWVRTRDHVLASQTPIQHDNWEFLEYPGSLGGKAGFTDIARHTFVGAAERDGRRLVVTVLGAENIPARGWQQTTALLEWGFAQPRRASVGHLVEPSEVDELLASPRPQPADPVVVAPVVPVSPADAQDEPGLLLVASIGAAAVVSLAAIAVTGRRRRSARANAPAQVTTISDATTPGDNAPGLPPTTPPAPPMMGQPPPPPPT